MKFDDVLLALIARQRSSGYDLGRWLATEGIFIRANADQSQIYKTLSRLVDRGYLTFSVEKREGAPDAKVYALTEAGADRLERLTAVPYVPPPRWQEADFTAWYTLLGAIKPERVAALIDTELEFRRRQVAAFRERSRAVRVEDGGLVPFDVAAMERLFDDLHDYNTTAMDQWLTWLETAKASWAPPPG